LLERNLLPGLIPPGRDQVQVNDNWRCVFPVMKNQAILAVAAIENVLEGLDFQQLPWPALISLYASVSAVTATIGFKFDSEAIAADGSLPNVAVGAGIVRKDTDVLFFEEFAPAFTNLKLRAQGSAAAESLNWLVEIQRVA